MATAEALEQRVGLIIWCQALGFGGSRLRCPEVLSVGGKHCGHRLSVFLGTFAEKPCRPGIGGSGTYHRIERAELPEVLAVVLTESFCRCVCRK